MTSLCVLLCAIMEFSINNKLTYSAIAELLKLLHLLWFLQLNYPEVFTNLKNVNYFTSSHYHHRKICTLCKECTEICQCDKPIIGDLLTVSIDKPLEVIVTSKLCLYNIYLFSTWPIISL